MKVFKILKFIHLILLAIIVAHKSTNKREEEYIKCVVFEHKSSENKMLMMKM